MRKAFYLGDLLNLSKFTGAARWFVFPFQLSLEYNSQVQDEKRVFLNIFVQKFRVSKIFKCF